MKTTNAKATAKKLATVARQLDAVWQSTQDLFHDVAELDAAGLSSEQQLALGALFGAREALIRASHGFGSASRRLADTRTEAELSAAQELGRKEALRERTIAAFGCANE